ncbi:syntaxin-binding protein 1-like [Melanaphis sacchari]|uniref:syntaxin-binding protein 1-like n=1 Tax=Melanaphis sacchari TaxID=742174 RepID=UPI000DC15558|nr:syntaxin-binding protein 1-like [Melanaphis sacchari]
MHRNLSRTEDKKKHRRPERKNRVDENTYQVSRWTPLIKDLMENCIENKLDPKQFPFVGAKENSTGNPTASRYTLPCASWYKPKKSTENNGSRIILFMLGGVSYSEMRCAYEVSKNSTNWEFIIGSSNPLTPNQFIQNLSKLHNE